MGVNSEEEILSAVRSAELLSAMYQQDVYILRDLTLKLILDDACLNDVVEVILFIAD